MKILKVTCNLEPGDGTGSSPQDAMVRNEKGICGMRDCGKKINLDNKDNYHFFGIRLCDECSESIKQDCNKMVEETNKEFLKEYIELQKIKQGFI